MNIPVNIEDLTEEQAKDLLKCLSDKFERLDDYQTKVLLKEFIKVIDDLSCEDFFGTEGWKHFFGFED